ncbi:MAG: site-specific DNA-methyltransferase [Christensenellaceae bacterium]|jgi:adenine-specific DNA-methyltransferase|nr:site-specific DNA-methyltransferase [Christensenellaceae bacterium]
MDKMDGRSMDMTKANIEQLKNIFPEIVLEGKIDFERLKELLGEHVDDHAGSYTWNWKGKQDAIRLARKPSMGTLRPCSDESKNWDTTENLYIEGDNLEVLKLLQCAYLNSIKMIYIDPPYNTGNDFVYKDDYTDSIGHYKEITGQSLRSNPETAGRYHTNWLNMMYPRLKLARNLLREDGVIFISIDDNEQANLKKICDEVFGEENFRNIIATRRYDKNLNRQFMENGLHSMNVGLEFILAYSKSTEFKFDPVFRSASEERSLLGYWKGFWNNADRPTMRYEVLGALPKTGQWKWRKELAQEAVANFEEYLNKYSASMSIEEYWHSTGENKKFIRRSQNGKGMNKGIEHWIPPSSGILRTSNWSDLLASKPTGVDTPFDSPKNTEVIIELLKLAGSENDDIILDFFSGSATTAHSVMQLNADDGGNRKFIMVQLPELTDESSEAHKSGYKNICEIGKERIRRAGEKIKADKNTLTNDLDIGFKVFRLDSSNLKIWDNSPSNDEDEVAHRIQESVFYLVSGRDDIDVVFEIMLKFGLTLTLPVEQVTVKGTSGYIISNPTYKVFICLQPCITLESVEEMLIEFPSIATFVFADKCFTDANALINTQEILIKSDRKMRLF